MRLALAPVSVAVASIAVVAASCREPGRACRSTNDCVQNEICFPPGVSNSKAPPPDAAACATDTDCTGDEICADAACKAKPCSRDEDCQGVCVAKACYPTLGRCERPVN